MFNPLPCRLNLKIIDKPWFVYIILCDDDTLYTGIALDLAERLLIHQSGKGAKYTRSHGAKKIIFSEQHKTRAQALVREAEIKKLPRKEKVKLVNKKL
mgnify:CR=1 FL=1